MNKAIFYHAGCPVCLGAEQMFTEAIDLSKYTIENVHLGEQSERIEEAEQAGVQSVPALVLNGQAFHINFGAFLNDLKPNGWCIGYVARYAVVVLNRFITATHLRRRLQNNTECALKP